MSFNTPQCESTYRLVAVPGRQADERFIEFRATGKEAVLLVTERHFANQDIEVYSDGRALCRVFAGGGYWVINPPRELRPAGT